MPSPIDIEIYIYKTRLRSLLSCCFEIAGDGGVLSFIIGSLAHGGSTDHNNLNNSYFGWHRTRRDDDGDQNIAIFMIYELQKILMKVD